MLEFTYQPQVFHCFYRGEGRSDGTLIEWDSDLGVFVLLDFDLRKQQSRGDITYLHEE